MVSEGVGSAEQLPAGDKAGFEGVADGGGQLIGVEIACGDVEECPQWRGQAEPLPFRYVARREDAAMQPNAFGRRARKFVGTVR